MLFMMNRKCLPLDGRLPFRCRKFNWCTTKLRWDAPFVALSKPTQQTNPARVILLSFWDVLLLQSSFVALCSAAFLSLLLHFSTSVSPPDSLPSVGFVHWKESFVKKKSLRSIIIGHAFFAFFFHSSILSVSFLPRARKA